MTLEEYKAKIAFTLPFGNDGRGIVVKWYIVHWVTAAIISNILLVWFEV